MESKTRFQSGWEITSISKESTSEEEKIDIAIKIYKLMKKNDKI